MDNLTRNQIALHYLKSYLSDLKSKETCESKFGYNFFTYTELHRIRTYLNYPPDKLISDVDILSFVLSNWENEKQSKAPLNREYFKDIIHQLGFYGHYLEIKPFRRWDKYDHSNFNVLRIKSGKAKYGYAIFTSDVKREDIHHVTSPPIRWFTDLRFAESKKEEMILLGQFEDEDLVIHGDLRFL